MVAAEGHIVHSTAQPAQHSTAQDGFPALFGFASRRSILRPRISLLALASYLPPPYLRMP